MTINEFVDKAFCINLDRRPDKWRRSQAEFEKNNIKVERFEAIDGKDMPGNGHLTGPEIGCLTSHMLLLKQVVENGWKRVLITEDDCRFVNNLTSAFAESIPHVPSFDMLYLGGHILHSVCKSTGVPHTSDAVCCELKCPHSPERVNAYFSKSLATLGAFCYIITLETAKRLLPFFERMDLQSDQIYKKYHPAMNCYVFDPLLAWHGREWSDIENRMYPVCPCTMPPSALPAAHKMKRKFIQPKPIDQNYPNHPVTKIELEITLRCNHQCVYCDRMVGIATPPNSDMTLDQIDRFIGQIEQAHRDKGFTLERILVMGGEPLIHPNVLEIWEMLHKRLAETKIVEVLDILTNGKFPIPEPILSDVNRLKIRTPNKPIPEKMHRRFYLAPVDMPVKVSLKKCDVPVRCGITMNAFGYYPCGGGGAIDRLFGLNMSKNELPLTLDAWNYNDLCKYCSHCISRAYNYRAASYTKMEFSKTYLENLNKNRMLKKF